METAMELDKNLENILKPLVDKGMETTFRGLTYDDVLWGLLGFLASKKRIKLENGGGGKWVWVTTDKSLAATSDAAFERLGNVVPFAREAVAGQKIDVAHIRGVAPPPRMLPSLQIIIDAAARQEQFGTRQTSGTLLVALLGAEYVEMVDDGSGQAVCVPTLQFLKAIKDNPAEWFGDSHAGMIAQVRVDNVLQQGLDFLSEVMQMHALDRPDVFTSLAIRMLVEHESRGDAIAYCDADGLLAWKASEKLRRELADGDGCGYPRQRRRKRRRNRCDGRR
jgi:hypothetical protein